MKDCVFLDWIDMLAACYTLFTWSNKYLNCDLDLDSDDLPVYMGHPLFNTTKRITLFSPCYIAIHLISALKLSRTSVYTGPNFSIQIAIKTPLDNFTLCNRCISYVILSLGDNG